MEKIIEKIDEWALLKTLPAEYMGFQLDIEKEQQGTQYRIFSYRNQARHRCVSALYDHATRDFLVRLIIGLTEYCEVIFISPSMEFFERMLNERLFKTLSGMAEFEPDSLSCVFRDKKVLEWPYGARLPENIAGFSLFIRPREPVKVINGSYIVIDYSDFAVESNLIIYYNIYRDEFFGEIRVRRTPEMVAVFDSRNLEELQEKLTHHLQPVLEQVRHKVEQET
ncbi:Hypothetical protein LUCI_1511 [Lucifera butyrica]|uniref:Uncharacterized protein n=1 Tax=Lucifera butyrica TaxID=1351585 RepID=A0A498R616_9FIRM|nr:hypothetical protein [Lucifera butyrica]VBB06287.1 Hypothetical protein LUCI_1511 [Lucifera butyrica]